jgi:hypothetical protein
MALRALKLRGFARVARKEGVSDRALLRAAQEIDAGLIDARLGGCLVKKRLARTGGGKRGGYRLIVAYRQADRVVCLFLFGKNERDNISIRELHALLLVGEGYVSATADQLTALVAAGELIEVTDDGG